MSVREEITVANRNYVRTFGDRKELSMPPRRRFLVLTCMDARLDPAKFAGLSEGDAHVVRNAGGRVTDDAIRSLVISHKLLGTREWFVIHHTDCGMEYFIDPEMAALLEGNLSSAELDDEGWHNVEDDTSGSVGGHYIRWLTIDDTRKSVVDDVRRLREHPLVSPHVAIYGYLFDVKTGELIEIPEASRVGQPARGNFTDVRNRG